MLMPYPGDPVLSVAVRLICTLHPLLSPSLMYKTAWDTPLQNFGRQNLINDSMVGPILRAKTRGGQKLQDELIRRDGSKVQRLHQLWDQLVFQGGLLYGQYEDSSGSNHTLQLVIPQALQQEIKQLHAGPSGCHLGIRSVPVCQKRKTSSTKKRGLLQLILTCMDIPCR